MKTILASLAVSLLFAPVLSVAADAVTKASVKTKDCKRLMKRNARVGANYKAGVDVRGKKVKSADLDGGSNFKLPKEITIDFGLDLAGKYGISGTSGYEATAGIGTIKYDLGSGALTFNGKPMNTSDQAKIQKACAKVLSGK
ncbi:MAG: hypothetical protein OQK24_06280 [Magnetovibrio sp.]|nr:hypothetical protein [Magnetovibrio sp.]